MVSLIIAYYKNIPALNLIFKSMERQTCKEFEVIVAEDDNAQETIDFIAAEQKKYSFPIVHVSHENVGFRKCKILNASIQISKFEKLVFIDGDCIPHKHFISAYNTCIQEGGYYYGRRVMLNEAITQKFTTTADFSLLTVMSLKKHKVPNVSTGLYLPLAPRKAKPGREIWGCNWGVLKKYVVAVNGFDEDYTKACFGEDLDIGWRLRKQCNLTLYSIRTRAIQYHLHHERGYEEFALREMYLDKINYGIAVCKNGIIK